MDDIARLAIINQIENLKARYFRFMDAKQWDDYAGIFTRGAVMDMRAEVQALQKLGFEMTDGTEPVWRGSAAISAQVAKGLTGCVSVHHGYCPEIEVKSATAASGIWAMEDIIDFPAGSAVRGFHGFGHYHETYAWEDGSWRIATLNLSRIKHVIIPAS